MCCAMEKRMFITTDRLKMKVLKVSNVTEEYISSLNNPEINKFLVNVRLKRQTYRTVSDFVKMNLNSKESILLGIFIKSHNKLIGTIRIHDISYFHYSCIVGICIFNKVYWGQGYASEALKHCIKYIFETLKLHYIEAGVYKENKSSVNLFKKTGFKLKASFKNKYRHIDSFREVLIFGKINPNFDYYILKCKNR